MPRAAAHPPRPRRPGAAVAPRRPAEVLLRAGADPAAVATRLAAAGYDVVAVGRRSISITLPAAPSAQPLAAACPVPVPEPLRGDVVSIDLQETALYLERRPS